ncbi:MAG: hypothetical protein Q9M36_01230 [Sulfurovum sp.]|nr:hypothetical protein [Sulfurovum sp.]
MLKDTDHESPSLCTRLKKRFCKDKANNHTKKVEHLEEKHIAYHSGKESKNLLLISQMIVDMGTKEIVFPSQTKLLGLSILESDKDLALKKAGTVLLDAYDSGAEVLIIEDKKTYEMCSKYFKKIEHSMGRKMGGLALFFVEDFIKQVDVV